MWMWKYEKFMKSPSKKERKKKTVTAKRNHWEKNCEYFVKNKT